MKCVNHRRRWRLFDAEGDCIAEKVASGWEDDAPGAVDEIVYDNLQGLRNAAGIDDDEEFNVGIKETGNCVYSIELSEWKYNVTADDVYLGTVEYTRECDAIDESELRSNCEAFDELTPAEQLQKCRNAEETCYNQETGEFLPHTCPRCGVGCMHYDYSDLTAFARLVEFECSACELSVSSVKDTSLPAIAERIHGQTTEETIYAEGVT